FFFFFSSRRRHTRLQGDWSSDVCSSDLFVHDLFEKGIRVRFGVERHQVVDLFAGADEANGQAEFARDGHDDAAFGRAVELGEDNPGDADGRGEFARLRQAVLPGGRVKDQENVVGRAGNHLGSGALHFFELGHQVGLGVQTASGIHNDDVGGASLSGSHGVVHNGGRVG